MKSNSPRISIYSNVNEPWCPNCRAHRREKESKCATCGDENIFIPAEARSGFIGSLLILILCCLAAYFWKKWCLIPGVFFLGIFLWCYFYHRSWVKWTRRKNLWERNKSSEDPEAEDRGEEEGAAEAEEGQTAKPPAEKNQTEKKTPPAAEPQSPDLPLEAQEGPD